MRYYSHRKHLIHVEEANGDGFLHTIEGIQPVKYKDKIAVDEFGNQFVIPLKYFNDTYVEVQKVESDPVRKRQKSPFEEQYERRLMEFGSLPNPFEDQEYIDKQMKMSKQNN